MLRESRGARRYNEPIMLTLAEAVTDAFGHAALGEPVDVLAVYAQVRQMSATKTMMTFQQADVVGVDIEFRLPHDGTRWNGITWRGRRIHFPCPEVVDERNMVVRVSGWYQADNPVQGNG